jgi:hypothetical protein
MSIGDVKKTLKPLCTLNHQRSESIRYVHKVLIYIEHHSVCHPSELTPPPLLLQASVPSPPDQRVGGHTRLRLKGMGSPNSDDWRKSLALCLLCGYVATAKKPDYRPGELAHTKTRSPIGRIGTLVQNGICMASSAGILKQSMGARNRLGMGLS